MRGDRSRASAFSPLAQQPTPAMFAQWLLHIDDDIVVVDKPAGVLSQGGEGGRGINLVDLARAHFAQSTLGVAHRLDRNVSGLVVVTRSHRAGRAFAIAMQRGTIDREYNAVVHGAPEARSFVVEAPLTKRESDNTVFVDVEHGSPAQTNVRVERTLKTPAGATLAVLCVRPITGRSHQIRVHLAHVGLPIVGDPKYGAAFDGVSRPLLHASRLSFDHPVSRKRVEFVSEPPWTDADLAALRRTTDGIRRSRGARR